MNTEPWSAVVWMSRCRSEPYRALFVVLLLASACPGLELVRVATLPARFGACYACADANHNTREECYGTCGLLDSMWICEDTLGNSFELIRTGLVTGVTYDVGFRDEDSLAEMLAAFRVDTIRLYRAVSRDSFPTREVWKTYTSCQVDCARFCRLRPDGPQAFVMSGWLGDGAWVYENRGGDSWAMIPFPRDTFQAGGDIIGYFTIGDFDSDAKIEIIGGTSRGKLYVAEFAEGDSFVRTCSLSYYPYETQAYYYATANDMDRNGHPELISLRRLRGESFDSSRVRVYEEPSHGQFVCVWYADLPFTLWAGSAVATGDADGDGIDEFLVSNGLDVRLFKCTGPARYEQEWQLSMGGVTWITLYDINGDGRCEMIISPMDRETTYVYEDTVGLTLEEFTRPLGQPSAMVQPSITRFGMPILFAGIPPGADIEVHSLDGRLVSRVQAVRPSNWTWNLRNQSGNLVPAGTYFAVIRSKGKSTSLKLCLVK